MKFNINETVRVRLTDKGKQILRRDFDALHAKYPTIFDEFNLPSEDSDGFSQWALWHLMETFGAHVYLGADLPFETDIEIPVPEDSDKKNTRQGGGPNREN